MKWKTNDSERVINVSIKFIEIEFEEGNSRRKNFRLEGTDIAFSCNFR